jgi:hypothetical protein
MIVTPDLRQAYTIACRMEAIFEAWGIEGQDWPWFDSDVRAQAHRELGVPYEPYMSLAWVSEGNFSKTLGVFNPLVSTASADSAEDSGDL